MKDAGPKKSSAVDAAADELRRWLHDVGAINDDVYEFYETVIRKIGDPDEWVESFPRPPAGHKWAFVVPNADTDPAPVGVAMPVLSRGIDGAGWLYAEVHSQFAASWLTSAWRADSLISAIERTPDNETLVRAALVRPLVELAAATWCRGRAVADIWLEFKSGRNDETINTLWAWTEMQPLTRSAIHGGKFAAGTDMAKAFGQFETKNVLTEVGHLAKVTDGDLFADYEWLCNSVHPSVGSRIAYLGLPHVHDTKTHAVYRYSRNSAHLSAYHEIERPLDDVVDRAALLSVRVLRSSLDATLSLLDDIALTCDVSRLHDHKVWRRLNSVGRNERCPCRSGRKSKDCTHDWSSVPSVPFPASFLGLSP